MSKRFALTSPRLREDDIEGACLDLLRWRGWYVIRLHAGRFKTADGKRWITGVDPGTPDYIAIHPEHRGFLLEVKRPGGELSPQQVQKIWELRAGYRLSVVAVDDSAALNQWLDDHEQNKTR